MIQLQTRTTHVLLLGLVWSIAAISLGAAKSLAQGVNVSTYVLEESEIGTSVVNLNNEIAYLQKQQQNGTGIVRPINVLRILDNSKFFYINDKSQLCVRERIDREALCTGDSAAEYRIVLLNDQCYIQLNIFVNYKQNTQNNDGSYSAAPEYTSGSFDTIPVYVMVRDVNDHYPEFTDDPLDAGFEIKVKEHVAIGTKFELPIASDADSGPNGELTYTVQLLVTNSSTGNSAQSINRIFSVENVREHEQANLIVLTDLDRETRAAYLLNLTVCDNGKPSRRCTSRKLTVTLVDMNDHAPTIVNASSYVVDVREDASVPLTLTKIEAIDNDDRDSQHGLLEFKIDASRSTAGASQQFAIDSATGNLRLISPLDREKLARHKVAVIVHDNPSDPSNSRSATCTVTVNVLDVNDQAPVIKVLEFWCVQASLF